MRRWLSLSGLLPLLVVLWGCTETPPPPGTPTEVVTLRLPFQETFADTEGAPRVVVCQLTDVREETAFIGEGVSAGVRRKFVVGDDLTLVLPRILGAYLKRVGFNVSFAPRLSDVSGPTLREILKRHDGAYLIGGRLEEFHVRTPSYAGQPVLVLVKFRLDIYNNEGRLRMYYPARIADSEYLGERAGDRAELVAFVNRTVHRLFARVFDDTYFVKELDLDRATVRELMKAKPVEPVEAEPEEPEAEETKPKELTEEEKAELERLRKARELEDAIKETMEP
ncbi:MAG: hypothetical protein AMS16_03695 [Planctomycetes bacterium DG_58]|nr:MAG: hypothetical protein AMS16_03695 [Planctomycetes bacterium DG_58]